jgi:lysozyme family protein
MSGWFEMAVEIVLEKEGLLSDDPRDNGGLTKYGISQKAYPGLDIRALTRDDAINLYRRDYWQAVRGDDLPWAFALPLFDCAVNQGQGTAISLFQHALRVKIDGSFGPATLAAAQAVQARPDETLSRFMAARVVRYAALSDWPVYGNGWAARCFHIALLARR